MLFRPLRVMASEPEGKVLVISAATVLTTGTVVYSILEGWSLLDALYFSVVTLATVGFGDLTPTTDAAKLFTIVYIITGIGILAAFVSELAKVRYASQAAGHPLAAATTVVRDVEQDIGSVVQGKAAEDVRDDR